MNIFHRSMFAIFLGMMVAVGERALAAEKIDSGSQPIQIAREIQFVNVTDKMVYLFYQAGPRKGRMNLAPNSPYTLTLCRDCEALNWKISTVRKELSGQQSKVWNRGRIKSGRYVVYYSPDRRLFDVMTYSQWAQRERTHR